MNEHCAWCGEPITQESERIVWNNDKVVCQECDSEATELDRN